MAFRAALTPINLSTCGRCIYFRAFPERVSFVVRCSLVAPILTGAHAPEKKENLMRRQFHAYATALVLLGGTGFAAAQTPPANPSSQTGQQSQLHLDQSQGRAVMDGLRSEQTQPAPSGPQAQIGSQAPETVTPRAMPDDVTAQVPETKNFLFVKLPDRVLIIDPDSKMVAEILLAAETTGSTPDGSPGQSGSSGQR
jgi:hypothetical protein